MIGPNACDRPVIELNTPMARARSAGPGKVVATIAAATGLSMVPPAACSTRAAISQPMLGARPHSSDPSPKVANPSRKTRRRPQRSAAEPASTRKAASTTTYASTVHCRPDTEACRSRRIEGSATLTAAMSITTTTTLVQQIASVRCGRSTAADGQPSTPVVVCALPTGLDCDEPRWRR
jgi:hypothetical protein